MKKNKPKIGLALGSGGARGLAHIGVLKVLKENNIPIDFIAGVSAGAVVGAYYSLNREIDSLEKQVLQLTKKDWFRLIDFSAPKRGIIAGNKIESFIRDLLEDKTFSNTKIPLKIIATNLESGREVKISEGRLAEALRASISIPGIFPPRRFGKKLLIDGGVVNPTPVDVVREMGADIVIGVDLTMKHTVKLDNPSIVDALIRSFEILRTQTAEHNLHLVKDAIIIRPNFSDKLDSFRFYEAQKFIEEGRRVAREALPRIQGLIEKKRSGGL